MWVRPSREYGLCSSVSLWLGHNIAVHHRGEKIQRITESSSPIANSEEPIILYRSDRHQPNGAIGEAMVSARASPISSAQGSGRQKGH